MKANLFGTRKFVFMAAVLGTALPGCGGTYKHTPATIGTIMRQLGFREMRPPTTLYPPGSIVTISTPTTDGAVTMDPVCSAKDVLGADPPWITSTTISSDMASRLAGGFGIGAEALAAIKADLRFKSVQNVKLSLLNTKIITVEQSKLFEAKPADYCISAIRQYPPQSLYLITTVFAADVDYTIAVDAGVSAEAKVDIAKELSARLSGGASSSGTSKISGNGLYWGERGDAKWVDVILKNADCQPNAPPVPVTSAHCTDKDSTGHCVRCEVTAKGVSTKAIGEGQSGMGFSCTGMKPDAEVEVMAGGKVWPVNNGLDPNNQKVWLIAQLTGTVGVIRYSNASHPNRGNMAFSTTTTVPKSGAIDIALTVAHVQTWPNEHGALNLDDDFNIVIRVK